MSSSESAAFLSPEWFGQKAQEPIYVSLKAETQQQLAQFQSQFGIEKLKALSGISLLRSMFYSDVDTKENLCYTLEMQPDIKSNFGSIAGGSAFKFGLFYHRQKQKWLTGLPLKPVELTEEEAIRRGTEIRDNLVAGAEEISNYHEPQSETDYEELKTLIEKHIHLDSIWVLKYFKMLFPAYFSTAFSEEHQRHLLYAFQIPPSNNQFVRSGQIALFSRKSGIQSEILGRIFADNVGWYKPFYRIGTGRDGTCFEDWKTNGYCALGFDEIGRFTDYLNDKGKADKDRIVAALLEHNDSYNNATAARKANEIVDFVNSSSGETMIVAMNGQQMLGVGLLSGDLYFDANAKSYANHRKVDWRYIPDRPIHMPVFEGKLTSFVTMRDEKNMMLIYHLLYHDGSADSYSNEPWWPDLSEYDPAISKEQWVELLKREDVLGPIWGGFLAAFYLHGPATCSEIGNIYNKTSSSLVGTCTALAKKIQSITQCPIASRENGESRYWTILFQGRNADKTQQGVYMWKLRPELYDALTDIGITEYEWPKGGNPDGSAWLLMWNPNIWIWKNYHEWIAKINSGIRETDTWSCANTHVKAGDKFYLAVCGRGVHRGLVGSGTVISPPVMRPHWNEEMKEEGRQYRSIGVEFDKLVDYKGDDILPIETLQRAFPNQAWSAQASGIEIRAEYTESLREMWYGDHINPIRFATGYTSELSRNRIIFGAPGTGKSFLLNQEKDDLLADGGSFERVTFHPDYTYAHFVGTYKPVPCHDDNGNNVITYKYVPGPFMRTYVKALRNSREETPQPYLLIIEEINRANVAAVFGDIFQLLDRDDDETSMYSIQASEDMKQYLAEELGGQPSDYETIKIPDNMFIWATMNSADQGVFPMDTAFKRRWDFTYLSIDSGEEGIAGKTVRLGTGQYERIVEWNALRHAINDRLTSFRVNEDKLLGPFFLSRKVIPGNREIDPRVFVDAFKNKVLMYLYDDAAKQKRGSLFADGIDAARYSSICDAFEEKGVSVFCTEISSQFQISDSTGGEIR